MIPFFPCDTHMYTNIHGHRIALRVGRVVVIIVADYDRYHYGCSYGSGNEVHWDHTILPHIYTSGHVPSFLPSVRHYCYCYY